MEWGPTPDVAADYSDIFQSVYDDNDAGIYLLEEDKDDPPHRDTREMRLSDVRMREPRRGRESFGVKPPSYSQYARRMPSQTELRSRRRGREIIDESVWDNRPKGFRADDDVKYSAFVPPAHVRPPRGGIITPWETSYAPTYSEAIQKIAVPDQNMVGLAPCGAQPTFAHQKEGFTGANGCQISSLQLGFEMVKAVLFFIIIVLLAMWLIMAAVEKRMGAKLKNAIRDAIAELKRGQ